MSHTTSDELETINSLAADLGALLRDESFSDFTIETKDESFPVHKSILAARSPVMKRMLSVDMKENRESVVKSHDVEASIIRKFIRYMYSDSLEFDKSETTALHEAKELLKLAQFYDVISLKKICERKLIEMSKDSLLQSPGYIPEMLCFADLHVAKELKEHVLHSIRDLRGPPINPAGFQELIADNPELGQELLRILLERPEPTPQETGANSERVHLCTLVYEDETTKECYYIDTK